jgi:hypothetical protein
MKFSVVIFALLAGSHVGSCLEASPKSKQPSAVERVVSLIADLKKKVETDGATEQASFDKYACWCEKTLERKAADIAASKELISETEILIKKLKGEISSHGAEVAQLNKDIAANLASQKEATEMRNKQFGEYDDEKSESEQCIGAMEAAIKVLTGAGTKKGFLDTSTHQAQLLSVGASLRSVLRFQDMPASVTQKDLDMVKSFVAKPNEFMGAHSMSAAQVGQNPFGDYAPQSTQIQGILKGMYDAFTADLEKDNAAESESQKSFEALIATKTEELATLKSTLQIQETSQAEKTKQLKESQVLEDDTTEQLEADENFFADSKEACQTKASEWSVRTRLRTEELNGMAEAMRILSSDDAKKTFTSATSTFLQLASVKQHRADSAGATKTYGQLRKLATQYRSLNLARIAAALQMGGHFDKVMVMIDDMMGLLRKEEAEDIVHRDLCESQQNANKNEIADLEAGIKKADAILKRYGNTKTELGEEIGKLETDIKATKKSMSELLGFRNKENTDHVQALKDDTDAVGLIRQAITALSKFYKDNKIALELVQAKAKAPEYAEDPDKAPESASFSDSYGGQKSQSGGILAILSMLAEDLEKEMADGRSDDADAQKEYEKQNGALQKTLDAQEETKVSLEEELAGVEEKIDAMEALKKGKSDDKDAEGDAKKALGTDCAWVKSHFDSRRDKRKDEMQGLVDAKAFLAGVDAGQDPLPVVP